MVQFSRVFHDQPLLFKANEIYCNGFDQRVARQQLCKHSPLLGYATIEEAVFSMSAVTSRSGGWWSRNMFPVMRVHSLAI
jgi:hypothetical protein